jgi:hypothetical protein
MPVRHAPKLFPPHAAHKSKNVMPRESASTFTTADDARDLLLLDLDNADSN